MTLIEIKEAYYSQYPNFKYHNMKFWQSGEEYFSQACVPSTGEMYGNIFKLDIKNLTFQKVIIGDK